VKDIMFVVQFCSQISNFQFLISKQFPMTQFQNFKTLKNWFIQALFEN